MVSLIVSALALFATPVYAASPPSGEQVTLAWDANTEVDLAGYHLHYGPASGQYDFSQDVGNTTSVTVSNLTAGATYYFVVTAYNTAEAESGPSNEVAYTVPPPPEASVVARWLFYNHSVWDNLDPAATADDDLGIATDKSALLPGNVATFANYSSYSRGLNGIMIDVADLRGTPTLADFSFRSGNDQSPATWGTAPVPASITVRAGAGVDGSDRVTLIWNDSNLDAVADANEAVAKKWLQVTVKATEETGLAVDDVFYFGNAVGEVGNSPAHALVDIFDVFLPFQNQTPGGAAPITSPYDINRDQTVDTTDVFLPFYHQTSGPTALVLLNLGGVGLGDVPGSFGQAYPVSEKGLRQLLIDGRIDDFVPVPAETPPLRIALWREGAKLGGLMLWLETERDDWQLQWTRDPARAGWEALPDSPLRYSQGLQWWIETPVDADALFFRAVHESEDKN
ncbi:MAG: fibronectin type III domain-containing protein [Verrucomicrobiales bacterium]|nr:fibronectin type III domain-containing protein [Verrucomicrobiales bacterium]